MANIQYNKIRKFELFFYIEILVILFTIVNDRNAFLNPHENLPINSLQELHPALYFNVNKCYT